MTVVFVGVRDVFVKWFLLECKLQDKRRESQHLTRVERSLYAIKQGVNWCLHGNNVTWERGRFTLLKDSSCLLRELPNNSKHGFLCSIYIQSIYCNIINTKRKNDHVLNKRNFEPQSCLWLIWTTEPPLKLWFLLEYEIAYNTKILGWFECRISETLNAKWYNLTVRMFVQQLITKQRANISR